MKAIAFVVVLSLALASTVALADVPGVINYQGTLTDDDGVALDTTVAMTFRIYTDSTGGSQVWSETQSAISVDHGLFNVLLGRVNAISDTVFNGTSRWLGVQVESDPEMQPRQRIASVGYAFQAAEADTADYSRNALAVDDGDWTISGSNMYSAVSGNVGIGTATPARKLDVQTTGGIGIYVENDHATLAALYARNYGAGQAARFQTGDVLVQYGDVLVNYGKVGIGTLTPSVPLHVRNSSGTAVLASATGSSGYGVNAYAASPTGIAVYGFNESESGNAYAFYGENISPTGIAIYGLADNGDEYSSCIGVYGRTDGDFGAAGVYGEATNTGGNNRGVWGHTDNANGHAGYFTGGRNYFEGSVGIGTTNPLAKLHVDESSTADLLHMRQAGSTKLIVQNDGDVGIGTSTPSYPLHVVNSSNDNFSRAIYGLSSSTGTGQQIWGIYGETNSTAITNAGAGVYGYANSSTGFCAGVRGETGSESGTGVFAWANHTTGMNVALHAKTSSPNGWAGYFQGGSNYFDGDIGIGTTTIDEMLHIENYSSGGRAFLKIESSHLTNWHETGLRIRTPQNMWHLRMDDDTNNNLPVGALGLRSQDYQLEVMTWQENGNVGIGTTTPATKLDVRGNIRISDISGDPILELGEGLDYAEGFDVADAQEIAPGSVLIIDPDNPGKLTVTGRPYDSKVAGIVAGAKGQGSGVRLGTGQFDHDVALAGRVYCNVDASVDGVEPGDLLTTSATPGYAMKATDYVLAQGAILGKAMEKLEQGQKGQILVLVTLQ